MPRHVCYSATKRFKYSIFCGDDGRADLISLRKSLLGFADISVSFQPCGYFQSRVGIIHTTARFFFFFFFFSFDGEQSLPGPALSIQSWKRKAGRSLRLFEPTLHTNKNPHEMDPNAATAEAAKVPMLMERDGGAKRRPQILHPKQEWICI